MKKRWRSFQGLAVGLPLAWLVQVPAAKADETCASAYEESQVARSEGRLRAAQRELATCTRTECAEFIRVDCARWLSEVESAQPTIVIRATEDGQEVTDVTADLDGETLTTQLDGKAVAVEPGRHVLTFQRGGQEAMQLTLVFREGEKNRPVVVTLTPPKRVAAPAPRATPVVAGRGPWPWVLLGIGAAGATGFGVWGALGSAQRHELERSCSPRCDEARIDAVRTKFLVADVSAAVGLLALAGSGYLFFAAPSEARAASLSVRPKAAGLFFTGQSLNAAARWSF